MSKTGIFSHCGSALMKEKLWRDMFIAHIFGIDMPENIKVCKLPENIKGGISIKDFSDTLASLLILYGGGYIDDDTLIGLFPECDNYSEEIAEVERLLVEQGNAENEDKFNGNIIRNVLMCAVNSKKYDEIQSIDIRSALALYDSTYTVIVDGFVHLKDKEYLQMVSCPLLQM